jgi:hypothetical protein
LEWTSASGLWRRIVAAVLKVAAAASLAVEVSAADLLLLLLLLRLLLLLLSFAAAAAGLRSLLSWRTMLWHLSPLSARGSSLNQKHAEHLQSKGPCSWALSAACWHLRSHTSPYVAELSSFPDVMAAAREWRGQKMMSSGGSGGSNRD